MNGGLQEGVAINRSAWLPPWVSVLAAVAILVTLGFHLGAGPFIDALHGISALAVVLALAITAGSTWCCARRWSLLADRLDVGVPTAAAFRAYYRAQFLNATLPGGILGEVDRAVWHGRSSQAMARGIRSVVWDRVTGQAVLFALVVVALPFLAPTVRNWLLTLLIATVAVVVVAALAGWKFLPTVWAEVKDVPAAPGVWSRVLGLSALAVAGHVVVFVVAARVMGVEASLLHLVALGLVILQAAAIPLNTAGWGPREGVAALVFGAAGIGASTGLAVSVTYGVLSTLATLPGAFGLRRRQLGHQSRRPMTREEASGG